MAGGLEVASRTGVCWLTEGYASQRDMALAIKAMYPDIRLLVSHRDERPEILGCGDVSLREPRDEAERLAFVEETIQRHAVTVLHAGRRGRWFESHRTRLEALGVRLSTGACREESFALADNKLLFADRMREAGLPAVPALLMERAEDLREALRSSPFGGARLCVKPVQGVYGQGFRILDDSVSLRDVLSDAVGRRVPSAWYLRLLEESPGPLLLMPYCEGDEYSVDMLVRRGRTLCSVQRRKHRGLPVSGTARSGDGNGVRMRPAAGMRRTGQHSAYRGGKGAPPPAGGQPAAFRRHRLWAVRRMQSAGLLGREPAGQVDAGRHGGTGRTGFPSAEHPSADGGGSAPSVR